MTGQKADVILCILIHAPSFGDNIADVFVVFLQTRLLIGHIGITIKDLCPAGAGLIFLYVPWILKFRTVVSENDGEILFKSPYPYGRAEIVNGIDHAFLCTIRKQNEDHEGAASEQQGKETFALITAAFYCIHLNDIKFRESLCILLKVNVGTLVTIHLLDVSGTGICALFTLFVAYSPWQINVSCGENSLIEIIIKSPPAYRDLITMNRKDMA